MDDDSLGSVRYWYEQIFLKGGAAAVGVGWRSEQGQAERFRLLLEALHLENGQAYKPALLDFGCGYGAFARYLIERYPTWPFCYRGMDFNKKSLQAARRTIADKRCFFYLGDRFDLFEGGDFGFVSGVFNMKGDLSDSAWWDFIEATLVAMVRLCRYGIAFNMLQQGGAYISSRFYHADGRTLLAYCRQRFQGTWGLAPGHLEDEFTLWGRWAPWREPLEGSSPPAGG